MCWRGMFVVNIVVLLSLNYCTRLVPSLYNPGFEIKAKRANNTQKRRMVIALVKEQLNFSHKWCRQWSQFLVVQLFLSYMLTLSVCDTLNSLRLLHISWTRKSDNFWITFWVLHFSAYNILMVFVHKLIHCVQRLYYLKAFK